MTAITVSWTQKVSTDWDPGKPITTTKLNQLYDSVEFVKQWVGHNYLAGAAQDHNHDGVNSALVPIGANYLRNGSFESGTNGWTITQYSGGTVAVSTSVPLDGAQSLAFTSTILANGGGDAVSNEYISCVGGLPRPVFGVVQASVANVSAKVEILWYDSAKTQISASTVWSSANTPTTLTPLGASIAAPSTARWMKLKITGGVPATGTATGTIYFDGLINAGNAVVPVTVGNDYISVAPSSVIGNTEASTNQVSAVELYNCRVMQDGSYRIAFNLRATGTYAAYGRIYKNGIALGTLRSNTSTSKVNYTEDFVLLAGDTIQIYAYTSTITQAAYVSEVSFGYDKTTSVVISPVVPTYIGER
jgi:hypothetical protein